ncbi:MAG: type II toxin-antitoxin system HicB family antitoxin [Bryobacteraceae bacterium]
MNPSKAKRYAVFIEKTATGFGAYVPDLPGCVAAGETYEETDRLIREAIPFHIEGLRLHGSPIPEPSVRVEFVEAEAPVS